MIISISTACHIRYFQTGSKDPTAWFSDIHIWFFIYQIGVNTRGRLWVRTPAREGNQRPLERTWSLTKLVRESAGCASVDSVGLWTHTARVPNPCIHQSGQHSRYFQIFQRFSVLSDTDFRYTIRIYSGSSDHSFIIRKSFQKRQFFQKNKPEGKFYSFSVYMTSAYTFHCHVQHLMRNRWETEQ